MGELMTMMNSGAVLSGHVGERQGPRPANSAKQRTHAHNFATPGGPATGDVGKNNPIYL